MDFTVNSEEERLKMPTSSPSKSHIPDSPKNAKWGLIATAILTNDQSRMKYIQQYNQIQKRRNYRGNVPFYFVKRKNLTLEEQSLLYSGKKTTFGLNTQTSNGSDTAGSHQA